jgi:sec-independent protein translocase protein TatA
MFGLTFQEVLVIGIIAIVLFGSKLPEVAKMLGGHYARFRKSLADLQSQVNLHEIYDPRPTSSSYSSSRKSSSSYSSFDDHDEATAPRFEPPPAEPQPGPSDSADAA